MDEIKKVYGPYIVTDPNSNIFGRKQVNIVYENGRKRTTLLSRHLMEQHLGRELDPNKETVDHIDGDFTNDSIENLQIIDRAEHARLDSKRVHKVEIICVWCGQKAYKESSTLNGNAKQGKAGPFCGNSCSGKYGASVQNGRLQPLFPQSEVPVLEREYYTSKGKRISADDLKEKVQNLVSESLSRKEKLRKEKELAAKEIVKSEEEQKRLKEAYNLNYCKCGKPISPTAKTCKSCRPQPPKISWPSPQEVLKLVEETNFSKAGKTLGVSDNAIRKYLRKNDLL